MTKEELMYIFENMFPFYADEVTSYTKTGSKMIRMDLKDGSQLTFLYISKHNWNLGTQPWRKPPIPRKMIGTKCELGKWNELKS